MYRKQSPFYRAGLSLSVSFFILSMLCSSARAGSVYAAEAAETPIPGWFTITWGDPADASGQPQALYELAEDDGSTTALHIDDALAQSLGGLLQFDRRRVLVTGPSTEMMPNGSAAAALDVRSLSLAAGTRPAAAERASAITGSQPWVSIMCKFSDLAAEPNNLAYFQGMYSNTYPGADHYWREQSYGIANVAGSGAAGWFTLPRPRSYYVYDADSDGSEELSFSRATADCTAAADATVDFSPYVGIQLMFNADLDGYAWGGSRPMALDGASRMWYVTWEPPWGYQNLSTTEHEMGHGFGLPHSSGDYGQVYDNAWDVMSDSWSNCSVTWHSTYGCVGQHTISYHKARLGWIPAELVFTLAAEDPATITLERLAQPATGNYRMAKIPIDGSSTHFYTVEARQLVGYDLKLPGAAVIIHEVNTGRTEPAHVVDIDENGYTDDAGAMWLPGEVFTDTANHISVRVDSATSTGFVVTMSSALHRIAGYVRRCGQTGLGGVAIQGLPGSPVTNASGYYTASVSSAWQGTAVPFKTGYQFSPATTDYDGLAGDLLSEDYTASSLTAPVPVEPLPDDTPLSLRPLFDWVEVPGAARYNIQISRNITFTNLIKSAVVPGHSYSPTSDLPRYATLYWRARAYLGSSYGDWSCPASFKTPNPPTSPGLKTPGAGSLLRDYTPFLDWYDSALPANSSYGFDHYELQVATDMQFQTGLLEFTTATGDRTASAYTIPDANILSPNLPYYWHVRAFNGGGESSAWSVTRSFRTVILPSVLVSPPNGGKVGTRRPSLDWEDVTGASGYKIQISRVATFATILAQATVASSTFTPGTNLPAGTTLYWRVQATGTNGPSDWSLTWSFTTPG